MLFLIMLTAAQAVITYTDLYFSVKDIETNELVKSKPIDIRFNNINTGTSINLTDYINELGEFSYRINLGNWNLVTKLDDPLTPEIDYSAERTFLIEENNPVVYETLYLAPVGAIEGSVVNPSGKLISNADLTFKCRSYKVTAKTDQFGSFKQDLLPVGQCKVQAAFDDFVGSATINVTKGGLSTTVVGLNRTLLSATKGYIYFILGICIIGFIVVFGHRALKKRAAKKPVPAKPAKKDKKEVKKSKKQAEDKKEESVVEAEQNEQKEELNPRARDIMKTLNEREREIVDSLLLQKDYKSTQAKLRNDTAIPKTSLVRIFQSLESKKVITVEVIGKLKKIELTDWFLGKD
ncbi:MAG: hypothetical protein KKE20_02655 [Nanoarchaeota archaeon]|nr:hypothetical protein [Nanoarchaeota archaeon]